MMGGTLSVESEEHHGTTFTMTLPLGIADGAFALNVDHEKIGTITVGLLPFAKRYNDLERLLHRYLEQMGVRGIIDLRTDDQGVYDVLLAPADQIDTAQLEAKGQYTIAVALKADEEITDSALVHPLYAPYTPEHLLEVLDDATAEKLRIHDERDSEEERQFRGHVLIAEDNKTNQMLISLMMDDYGIDYEIAENGKIAFEMYQNAAYDLVLMDINMPEMGGIEATESIRRYETKVSRKRTPIVALTANVMAEDRKHYSESGMDAHLGKPIETEALETVLARYLKEL